VKRSDKKLQAKIKKMSREHLEEFARYVVITMFGDSKEDGSIFVDSERDRDPNDIVADLFEDIDSCGLHPQDL